MLYIHFVSHVILKTHSITFEVTYQVQFQKKQGLSLFISFHETVILLICWSQLCNNKRLSVCDMCVLNRHNSFL